MPRRADAVGHPDGEPETLDADRSDPGGAGDGEWETAVDARGPRERSRGSDSGTTSTYGFRLPLPSGSEGAASLVPMEFVRRHAAVVLVALVVAVGIAATYLFRAHADSVPLSAVAVSSSAPSPGIPSSTTTAVRTTPSSPGATIRASASGTASAMGSVSVSVTVQVLGAVRRPGVVTLRSGARVQDALLACGGLLPSADPAELNLATVLQDADQVVVGTRTHPRGEVRQGSGTSSGAGDPVATTGGSTASVGAIVDLNTATLAQLDGLPGVGPVTAQKILDWRTQHGRFTTVGELQEVDGIGPKTYARLAPHVRVGS